MRIFSFLILGLILLSHVAEAAEVADPYGYGETAPVYRTRRHRHRHYRRRHYRHAHRGYGASSALEGASCSRFMTTSGDVGDLGQEVARAILDSPYKDVYLNSNALAAYCPGYARLTSQDDRLRAWVAFWEVLSIPETHCGADPLTYAEGKPEFGLWQLERSSALRAGRNRTSRDHACSDLTTTAGEAACAVSIMANTQFRHGEGAYSSGSYWGPIRWKSNSVLIPNMRRFDVCR